MPGMDGLDVLDRIRAFDDAIPVVIVSGHATVSTAVEATKRGAFDFIEKPLESERVLVTVRNAVDRRRLADENRQLRRAEQLRHEMVGQSPSLARITDAIRRAAPTNATVLVLGESGVGKELVARAIHRNSQRSRERFVQVNCAAIPEELIESELFGHEKGSFTGAAEKQIGKFEQADKGTIFLDEVGDMSAKTQAKVLRVLQEGEVERLGSSRTLKVDVRVIAATNKDLAEEVREGRFRDDLYYRLNVIEILAPALRERREDLPDLCAAILQRIARESGRDKAPTLSDAAMKQLRQLPLEGNVRELENLLHRALALSDGEQLDLDELQPQPADPGPQSSRTPDPLSAPEMTETPNDLQAWLDQQERAVLIRALTESGFNRTNAAERLGLNLRQIRYRMTRLGIVAPPGSGDRRDDPI